MSSRRTRAFNKSSTRSEQEPAHARWRSTSRSRVAVRAGQHMCDVEEPAVVDSTTLRCGLLGNRSSCRGASTSVLQSCRFAAGRRAQPTQVGPWRSAETIAVDEHLVCLELFNEVQQAMGEFDSDHAVYGTSGEENGQVRCAQ